MKDGRAYNDLYHAARSRAEADWLVGINATRALTCKYNAQLSCGRVQTPTLAMIAHREQQIRSFKPEDYYGLRCTTSVTGGSVGTMASIVTWTWQQKKSGSLRSFNKDLITGLDKKLKNQTLTVTDVHTSSKRTPSPGLYDLTELQRDANKRFWLLRKGDIEYHAESVRAPQSPHLSKNRLPLYRYGHCANDQRTPESLQYRTL